MKYIAISFGGALGALLRYVISNWINTIFPFTLIPWGTIAVNALGSFILSYTMFEIVQIIELPSLVIYFFSVGFLGAFTTFSTFTYEFISLYEESHYRGIIYMLMMLLTGIGGAYFGYLLSKIHIR